MKSGVRMLRYGFLVLIAAVLAAGCATEKASTSAVLRGMVYDENRTPVLDMNVSWVRDGATVKTTLSDIHGRYLIPEVSFGPVMLQFSKEGYEPLTWSFTFEKPTQVVYVQMANLEELLDDAADAIQKRNWSLATSYLGRVRKIKPDSVVASFLEAEVLSGQGSPDRAAVLLETLSSSIDPSFPVELALADLYQNKLGQPDKALLHLRRAVAIQRDIDLENRMQALEQK